jgi:prophage regulatory protein
MLRNLAAGDLLWIREPFRMRSKFAGMAPTSADRLGARAFFATELNAALIDAEELGPQLPARSLPKAWHRCRIPREDARFPSGQRRRQRSRSSAPQLGAQRRGAPMSSMSRPGLGARFLKMNYVTAKTSLHRATIYRLIKSGEFPPGTMIRPHRRAWTETSVDAWIAEKEAAPAY